MIIYRVSTSGREVLADLIRRSDRGEAYVKPEGEPARWIPADWIIEEES